MFEEKKTTRLSYLERVAYWHGKITSKDISDKFSIPQMQADQDIKDYIYMAPNNLEYDSNEQVYKPADLSFIFIYDENEYINILSTYSREQSVYFNTLPVITKEFDMMMLRLILRSMFNRSHVLSIEYQSLVTIEPEKRDILPFSLGSFKNRLHLRAYCFKRKAFRDFVLSRITSISKIQPYDGDIIIDADSHSYVTLLVKPHSKLTASQKKCVELEYDMQNGFRKINVEKSMLFYLLDELKLENSKLKPPFTVLELINRNEIDKYIK
ncbi:MAG TPA: WYL domain-containing protein [Victivallales bacterium]|nr:WYL domain-containing protein [Victivallales bacterium]